MFRVRSSSAAGARAAVAVLGCTVHRRGACRRRLSLARAGKHRL